MKQRFPYLTSIWVSRENLNAALGSGTGNASALRDKITETLRDNGGLKIVKMGAS